MFYNRCWVHQYYIEIYEIQREQKKIEEMGL